MTALAVPTPATELDAIPRVVADVRAAFDAGRTRPLEWRLEQLRRLAALVTEREDEFLRALEADLGKPSLEGWATDLAFVDSEVQHLARNLPTWVRPRKVRTPMSSQPATSRIVAEPQGVVLVIAPWNYPVQLTLAPLAAAIAAGNAAIVKPSEVSANTSHLLARLLPEYLDTEAIRLIEGGVAETTALLEQRFDHILYTGNGRVARVVMEAAARHLTPVTLELGGKSPAIVTASARLDRAARRIVWGKFLNAGQTCIAPDYVLVERAVHDELLQRMAATVEQFYGRDPKQSRDYGRIVSDTHFRRLAPYLADGTVVTGGDSDAASRYIAPTILRDVSLDRPVMQDEIFGPILPVLPVDGVGEAISFVRSREKPLALYVFSEHDAELDRVVGETSSGGVCVNATLFHVTNPHLPFGGIGPSGMGTYHGKAGFTTFSHEKAVMRRSTRLDPSVSYPPYSKTKLRILRRFL